MFQHAKRVPRWLVLIVALYIGYVGAYLAILPPLEGFDSFAHFNYINYLLTQRRLPSVDRDAARFSYELPQQPPLYYTAAAAAIALSPADYSQNDVWTRASENPYQQSLSPRWSVSLPNAPTGFAASAQIARWVSMLGGLLGVIATALLARRLFPKQAMLQALITSIVAFNPLYVYLSVTISNDAWAVGSAALVAWLLVRAIAQGTRWYDWLLFGIALGLASLIKYSVALTAVPAALALLLLIRTHGLRKIVHAGLFTVIGVLAASGFWHIRNLIVYGEVVPLRAMAQAIPTLLRETPLTFPQILAQAPYLARTYWGVYVGRAFTEPFYAAMITFAVIGILGAAVWLIARKAWQRREGFILLCCGVLAVAVSVGVIGWLCTVNFAGQARLLLVAAPAFAVLIAFGWHAWFNWLQSTGARRARWMCGLAIGFAVLPLLPLPAFLHDYAKPPGINANTPISRVFKATYAEGMQIVGADFPEGATASPSAPLPVTLYLQATKPIDHNYTLFMHIVDDVGHVLYQFDGVPFAGRHPTRQWRAGDTFADAYEIALAPNAISAPLPKMAQLIVGFYPINQPTQRVVAYDGNQVPIGTSVMLGKVRVLPMGAATVIVQPSSPTPTTPANAPAHAAWANGIQLIEGDVVQVDTSRTATRYTVDLIWQPARLIANDLTFFVHMLDGQGRIVAQVDQEPQRGRLPTSVWLPGEVVRDRIDLRLPAGAVWQRIQVGFYDQHTGKRVPLAAGNADTVALTWLKTGGNRRVEP
jgi:hypothetical protein